MLYEVAIVLKATDRHEEEILVHPKAVLAKSTESAKMVAFCELNKKFKDVDYTPDALEILCRPFA